MLAKVVRKEEDDHADLGTEEETEVQAGFSIGALLMQDGGCQSKLVHSWNFLTRKGK